MPLPIRFKAFRVARRATCPVFLALLLLPALLLGCDSFGTGSSGLSLTANVESISPSDSTVTLTLTNDSPSPVQPDFFCGLTMAREIDGTYERFTQVNRICALINGKSRSGQESLGSGTPPVAPGESIERHVVFQRTLEDATAIRFQVALAYREEGPVSSRRFVDRSNSNDVTANTIGFPDGDRFTRSGRLVSEEIQVMR